MKARTERQAAADPIATLHALEAQAHALTESLAELRRQIAATETDNRKRGTLDLLAAKGPQFLTVDELARVLQVAPRTIYGMRAGADKLPGHTIGRELRFDPVEVAVWLRQRNG